MSSNAPESLAAGVDSGLFRSACSRFATGVTIVTVRDSNGHPHGMTANSFTSVSLRPPLVLVCIDLRNAILGHFLTSTAFGIHILAEHQQAISHRFSTPNENRFQGIEWHLGELEVPIVSGVLATMECAVAKVMDLGDHTVLIGEVKHAHVSEGRPLVYFGSGYQELK